MRYLLGLLGVVVAILGVAWLVGGSLPNGPGDPSDLGHTATPSDPTSGDASSDPSDPTSGDASSDPTDEGSASVPTDGQATNDPTGTRVVGSLVVSWSEADVEADSLEAIRDTRLITDSAGRDAFVADLPVQLITPETSAVSGMDMDANVLVVGSFHDCAKAGQVVANATGTTLTYEVVVTQNIECVWAPLTVQVWQVPRTDLASDVELASSSKPAG